MKLFYRLFYLTLILFLFTCNKNSIPKNVQNKTTEISQKKLLLFKKNNNELTYLSTVNNQTLKIDFKVDNKKTSTPFHEILEIDISGKDYAADIANSINDIANNLAKKYSLSVVDSLSNLVMNMINSEMVKMNDDEISKITSQGLFMCYSLIQTTKRIIKNSKRKKESGFSITSTPYKGFQLGLSPFFLNEDITINVENFINFIENNPDFSKEKGAYVFKEVLEKINEKTISAKKLFEEINIYVETKSNKGQKEAWWPSSGSEHGCCGNYSGPCYYWNPLCYMHDVMCIDCEPSWFCFSGCIPDAKAPSKTIDINISTTPSQQSAIFIF